MLKLLKQCKISGIGDLATNATLTAVEDKIPKTNSIVKKNRLLHKNY